MPPKKTSKNSASDRKGSSSLSMIKTAKNKNGVSGNVNSQRNDDTLDDDVSNSSLETHSGTKPKSQSSKESLCGDCQKTVKNDKALLCEVCENWFHNRCSKVSDESYEFLQSSKSKDVCAFHWYCNKCNKSVKKILNSIIDIEARLSATEDRMKNIDSRCNKVEEKTTEVFNKVQRHESAILNMESNVDKVVAEKVESVQSEILERDSRKNNIVVFGVDESTNPDGKSRKDNDVAKFKEICDEIDVGINPDEVVACVRLGQYDSKNERQKSRPVKIILSSETKKREILSCARKLNSSQNSQLKKIRLKPDLTPCQREEKNQLIIQLKEKQSNGEDWIIRNGKIVKARQRQTADHLPPRMRMQSPQNH